MSAAARVQLKEGTQTTISQDGKTTTISTDAQGVTTIRENGRVKTVIDPRGVVRNGDGENDAEATTLQPPIPPMRPGFLQEDVPDSVLRLIGILISFIAVVIIGLPITRALGRRIDRKTTSGGPDPDVGRRLERIEQAIETMAVEVERVSEAQRYSARLLTERLPDAAVRPLGHADQILR